MIRRTLLLVSLTATLVLSGAAPTIAVATPAIDGGLQEVTAVTRNADGTTLIQTWLAAPGVSANTLYQWLSARGERGLIDPALHNTVPELPRVSAFEPDCTMGGAYALDWRCGSDRFRWAGAHPQVYFMDHTGTGWPVRTASDKWNQAQGIDSIYRWHTLGCPGICVHVYNADYGAVPWVGHAPMTINGTTIVWAKIELNDHQGPGYIPTSDVKWHRETTCHELGHTLGLDHNTYESSCMHWRHTANRSVIPNTGDYDMLASIY